MDNLKELSLENYDFTIIPEDIRDLENLRVLSFNADWLLKVEENQLPEKLEELNVFRQQIDDKVLKELKEKRPLLKINFYDR
ncbi:hypothetical protein [Flavobacterium sp. AG291]|uniref:hypothetical protein n=1 Tax=Flavobacterium sp. AG291 TaxID=2184000 RepID=UPI000E2A7E85|nr:hypothetical protein [Flavobacterium sp. AG291]RDI12312.1 hypothetical protein DEU42_104246 [Flavobacterium sp. AG291]